MPQGAAPATLPDSWASSVMMGPHAPASLGLGKGLHGSLHEITQNLRHLLGRDLSGRTK